MDKKQWNRILTFALLFVVIVTVAKLAAASEFWAGLLLKLVIIALVIDALAMIVLVMFQDSKSGGLTGLMGAGGAMDTVIGPRTGEHINRITTFFAVIFFSLVVATGFLMRGAAGKSVVSSADESAAATSQEGTPSPEGAAPADAPAPEGESGSEETPVE